MSAPIPTKARGARILLIDNYSSFTYNLYQYLAELCGVAPMVLRNDSKFEPDLVSFLEAFDGVVLSPGPGHPSRARDFGICSELLAQHEIPILGVCLGHEGLGAHHGARIERAKQAFHGRASRIRHQGDALFAGMPEVFAGVRYHSLAVAEPLPAVLKGIAYTEEGELMAMRHSHDPHWGVQFHPESAETEYGKELLANFCSLTLANTETRKSVAPRASALAPQAPIRVAAPIRRWRLLRCELAAAQPCAALFGLLYADSTSAFWLDGEAEGSVSYMGDAGGPNGYRMRFSLPDATLRLTGAREATQSCASIFDYLEQELSANQFAAHELGDGDSGFHGGFVGYFGYELKGECGARSRHRSKWPDAHWIFCDRFVVVDHKSGSLCLMALVPEDQDEQLAESWFEDCRTRVSGASGPGPRRPGSSLPTQAGQTLQAEAVWRDSRDEYLQKISRCQEEILAGESYELCLTTQAEVFVQVEPVALFEALRDRNPAPYAAFLACGDFALVSTSPERFLKVDRERRVESKPIKGTAARGDDEQSDSARAAELLNSPKERAENLMIVDLVRNDLGRSCEIGSIKVEHFAALESFATVHQLVSTISGRVRRDVSALSCVRAAFPGGSMTGAPKLRSMEILDEMEAHARGPYSGSIGYLSLCNSLDLSIVIRTVLVQADRISVGVGGAITALSNPESEFEEVLLKARAPLAVVQSLKDSTRVIA